MKMMSKFLLFLRIESVSSLFFQTFCKKILRDFTIIVYHHPQIELALISWSSCVFLVCHSQLNLCFQNRQL